MLRAIAIYSDTYTQLDAAPQKSSGLFSHNPLEEFEKNTLSELPKQLPEGTIYHSRPLPNGEHHYVQKIASSNIVIAITSKSTISKKELDFLFTNINHIHLKRKSIKVSLNDVVLNPYAYTGKDLLIEKTSDHINSVKNQLHSNVVDILKRGENLEVMEEKAINLEKESETFYKKSKKVNSCCR
jgi:hypothetical protein